MVDDWTSRRSRILMVHLAVFAAALLVGCDRADLGSETKTAGEADVSHSVIEWIRQIELEESDAVINVAPEVSYDPAGGFLIADRREGQLRRYAGDGSLLLHVGRRGGGPDEFGTLTVARRLPSGRLLAADYSGKIAIFTPEGDSLLSTARTEFTHIEDALVLDDSLIVFAAWGPGGSQGPRVHWWNLSSQKIERSFFQPMDHVANRDAAVVASWTRIAARADTLAVINATIDSVYFYTLDGTALRAQQIPSSFFRPASAVESPKKVITDPRRRAEWLASFDMIGDVHWLADGRLLVGYMSVDPSEALKQVWHLLGMSSAGERLFEVREVPRLLAVDTHSGELVFFTPETLEPNRWSIGKLVF
jgi:hypothetical protein